MKYLGFAVLLLLMSSSAFAQEKKEQKSTAASNVSIIEKEFVFPDLNDISHKIWLYLPPNYHTTSNKFPVIYMHDAQNLFDANTSYVGEWEVDESLNRLFEETGKGFIVVGIEHGGEERINEYTPWTHEKYGGGKGAIYIDFLVNTLKPYIDKNYRTKIQAKHTALMGSSLGGLISYYGGLKHPDVFGKVGALSPSFWFSDEVNTFTLTNGNIKKQRMYLTVGKKEDESMVLGMQKTQQLLLEAGYSKNNLNVTIFKEGTHSESSWSTQFLEVVRWLYQIKQHN